MKALYIVVLFVSSWSSSSIQLVKAGTSADVSSSLDNSKDSSINSDQANQALLMSQQASDQRATSVSDLTTPFNNKDQIQEESSDLLNSLNSPLVISTTTSGITTGDLDSSGTFYLQADVSYLVKAYYNDTDSATTTTITIHDVNGALIQYDVTNFTLYEKDDRNSKAYTVAPGGKSKSNNRGDVLSNVNATAKSANVYVSKYTPVDLSGNKIPENKYPAFNNSPYTLVSAQTSRGTEAFIRLRPASVSASLYVSSVFDNTKVKFWIDDSLRERLVKDAITKAKSELAAKNVYSLDGDVKITWNAWYWNNATNKPVFEDTKTDTLMNYDPNANTTDDYSKINQTAYNYDHTFFVPGVNSGSETYIFADITLGYVTEKKPLIGKPTYENKTYTTRIDGWQVEPSLKPDPNHIPEVSLKNTISNSTNPANNETSEDGNVYTINHTQAGDVVDYTGDIDVDYENAQSLGVVLDGTYSVDIPKGMNVSDVKMKALSTNVVDSSINPNDITIEDHPTDPNKQILKINGIALPESTDYSTSQNNFQLTFKGTIPDKNTKAISFTPTFNGEGSTDSEGNPIYIKEAVGVENNINFDDAPVGDLSIKPVDISFGAINSIVGKDTFKGRVTPNSSENVLDVSDTRAVKTAQTLSISADGLTSEIDKSIKFPGNLIFRDKNGNDRIVDNNGQTVISTTEDGETVPSVCWQANEGLLLKIQGNTMIPRGKYSTTVNWNITDSIPNA